MLGKQYILCYLVKSNNHSRFVIGPRFSLSREQIIKVVQYLKDKGVWKTGIVDKRNLFVEAEFVEKDLGINKTHLQSKDHSYFFDSLSISSQEGVNDCKDILILECRCKENRKLFYSVVLPYESAMYYFAQFYEKSKRGDLKLLVISHLEVFVKNDFAGISEEIDYDIYNYFLKKVEFFDYVLLSTEDWYQLED